MSNQSQDDLFRKGTRYLEFGEVIAARDTFLELLEIEPTFAKGWNSLGSVYEHLEEFDDAIDCFTKATELDPDWIDPLVNLGELEYSQRSHKSAKATLLKYLELGGTDIDILLLLSRSAFELEDCKTVQEVTTFITELEENVYEAWELKGLCYAKEEKFSSALVALNVALELNPRSITALNTVGNLCYDCENYEGATSFFEPSLKKKKHQPEILFRYGTSLWFLNRWNEAISFLNRYTELVPDDPAGWNNLGVALREKGEVTRSLECYKKALQLNPELEIVQKNMNTAMYKEMIV